MIFEIFQDLSVRTQNGHGQTDMSVRAQIGYGRTSSYQGYYWTPKMDFNWSKQHNELFFFADKKSLVRRPKPSAGARSGPT